MASNCFYKYVSIETGLKILENQTIRFSNPKSFNDPYDSDMPIVFKNQKILNNKYYITLLQNLKTQSCDLLPEGYDIDEEITKFKNSKIELKKNGDIFLKELLSVTKKYMRVLSLSQKNNNILMWGHYANSHTGIVIGFKKSLEIFRLARKVKYRNTVYQLSEELLNDPFLNNIKSRKELNRLLLTKSSDWKYEKEYRCIFDVVLEYNKCKNNKGLKKQYPQLIKELEEKQDFIHIPFSISCVDSIYLGVKIDKKFKDSLLELLKFKYPVAKIYQGVLSEKSFEVIFNEINN